MSLNARKDRCRDNADRTNEFANAANDRANDAQSHTNNSKSAMSDARWYADEAVRIANIINENAKSAEKIAEDVISSIKYSADNIVTETLEERTALNNIVKNAKAETDKVVAKAKLVRDTADPVIKSANDAKNVAYSNIPNAQPFANAARTYANFSRTKADECYATKKRGDGGDDKRSNNERNDCENAYKNALAEHDKAKNVINNIAWPKRVFAENSYNNAISKQSIARKQLQDTSDAVTQSDALKKIMTSISDYGHDHNFDWLNEEIKRVTDLRDGTEKQKSKDQELLDKNNGIKKLYDLSLNAYVEKLKAEKSKGSAYDQSAKEMNDLTTELKTCKDKIQEYTDEIKKTNEKIAMIAKQLEIEQTNLTNAARTKDQKMNEMKQAEQKYNDLSGALIKLENDKSTLQELITSEESNYIQLEKYITKLELTIANLKMEDYSSKVFNNQNLLNFNQDIDKDLQYVFSDLKTQNINPDLLFTKIKYREIEEQKLSNTDKLLDILFYCFYFAFIIIRVVTRNTQREDFLIYIFIGLIPFVYPVIYKNSNYVIRLFYLDTNKNAFIESETENNFSLDAYNI